MDISKEDYLRIIYEIYERDYKKYGDDYGIKAIEISKKLKVSKSGVSQMLRKLKKKGFISLGLYSKIRFTGKGLIKAKTITKNHRIIEVFLKKTLKLKSKKTHDEAHKLEHAFSEEGIRKLDLFLKKPKICPEGRKIPR